MTNSNHNQDDINFDLSINSILLLSEFDGDNNNVTIDEDG